MSKKRLSKTLLKHSQNEEELESRFLENEDLFQIIVAALTEKIEQSMVQQRLVTDYGAANWGFKQADHNATQRTLAEIIDLLTFKE